jgi:hypothetical protein
VVRRWFDRKGKVYKDYLVSTLAGLSASQWDSPARADTFTLRDAHPFYSILLEVSGTHVAKR